MLNSNMIKAFTKIIPAKTFEPKHTKLRYNATEWCFVWTNSFVALKIEIPEDLFIDAPMESFALDLWYIKAIKNFDVVRNLPNNLSVESGWLSYIIDKSVDSDGILMSECPINMEDLLEDPQANLFWMVENTSHLNTFFEVTQILNLEKSDFVDWLWVSKKEENGYKVTLITKANKSKELD